MSKKSRVFTTSDYWGNEVFLTETTWNSHIVAYHKEMVGQEKIVEQVIIDPDEIFPSTTADTGLAFISEPGVGPGVEGIRVLVTYSDVHYTKGASTGKIATAYPIDIIKYGRPNLGRSIYKKGGRK